MHMHHKKEIPIVANVQTILSSSMDHSVYSNPHHVKPSDKIQYFQFNFVGKLLGPKGNSLKRMQEETLTKMAVLGKGSMRDKVKEEEMRLSKDPKYQHLNDDLHVEITAFAPPAEAHARLSYALTEVRKYLIPDSNDHIRQLQMKELEILSNSEKIISDPSLQLLKTVSPLHTMQPLLVPSIGRGDFQFFLESFWPFVHIYQ